MSAQPDAVLAVDVGTSAVKAAVVTADGVLRSIASVAQRVHTDPNGASEHEPSRVLAATRRAIREAVVGVDAARIGAVAITGPRGSFLISGPDGKPRTPFLTWQDSRGAAEANRMRSGEAPADYRAIAGMEPDASSALPRLLWLRRTYPNVFTDGWRLRTPQGVIADALGGDADTVDSTAAAHVGLLDVHRLGWSPALAAAFGIDETSLPRVVAPGTVIGEVAQGAADRLGVPAGIPIVAAASDGICSELGAGVARPGQLYAYLGTAGALAGPIDAATAGLKLAKQLQDGLFLMPGSVPSLRRIVGLTRAGGSAVDWFRRSHGVASYAQLESLAAESPPGARGVSFVPSLAGDGVIVPDSQARGGFVGLSLATTRADLARAVLEGVALELRIVADKIADAGISPKQVALTGGGSRSDRWSQIVADALGVRVLRSRDPNPGLRGAAMFALGHVGFDGSPAEIAERLSAAADPFEPNASLEPLYTQRAALLRALRRAFHANGLDDALAATASGNASNDAVV
jgi:sugar (pentulose or hexulose) kinase